MAQGFLQTAQLRYEGEARLTADALSPGVLSRTTCGVMVSQVGQRTRGRSGPSFLQHLSPAEPLCTPSANRVVMETTGRRFRWQLPTSSVTFL